MRASDFRHPILIQQKNGQSDALGQAPLGWSDFLNTWAKVEQLSGTEILTANAEHSEKIAKFTIRWRSDVSILPSMRVVYCGVIYDITSVNDVTGMRQSLEIMTKAGMSNG